jgi:hypothetical protein
MLPEPQRRAAALAVSRYGADVLRVKAVVRALLRAQAEGKPDDLLERLVREDLLNAAQAGELRLALAKTVIDPYAGKPRPASARPTGGPPRGRIPYPSPARRGGDGGCLLRL